MGKRKLEKEIEKELLEQWGIPELEWIKSLKSEELEVEIAKLPIRMKAFVRIYLNRSDGEESEDIPSDEEEEEQEVWNDDAINSDDSLLSNDDGDNDYTLEYPNEIANPPTIKNHIEFDKPHIAKNMDRFEMK